MVLREFKVKLPIGWDHNLFDELDANISWGGDWRDPENRTANIVTEKSTGIIKQFIKDNNLEVMDVTILKHEQDLNPEDPEDRRTIPLEKLNAVDLS